MINHISFTADEERIVRIALTRLMHDILINEQKRTGRPLDRGYDSADYKEALYVLQKLFAASVDTAIEVRVD